MPLYKTTLTIENFEDLDQIADAHATGAFTNRDRYEGHPEMQNNCNVVWAAKALQTYVNVVGRDTIETSVSDLLGDLMHLCDAAGLDFDELVNKAEYDYGAEVEDLQ
ncbi:hypothetical protein [Mycolicibacterium aichiense]|uniref:Uncharacterized protein n=1 Tax=Mycolicibacterium aichiense TaxID=1799 RepID=A0AAD1MER6_9MYCO|nr:hypothetical protein [Mycolicibacterium aichiense]MCV7016748.1 hypothetical protein [Mycolicibacterium aichiense]QFG08042.1 hypothetical protein SEA_HERBERTWM_75 [Mycobacterium phage Herbertwm]BBX09469.1 hypothetical protein MAIC_42720 [Mycolicibacterium aichiense]SUA14034.1 Uncharacterised protein [Mycolicibacterium aichiense]